MQVKFNLKEYNTTKRFNLYITDKQYSSYNMGVLQIQGLGVWAMINMGITRLDNYTKTWDRLRLHHYTYEMRVWSCELIYSRVFKCPNLKMNYSAVARLIFVLSLIFHRLDKFPFSHPLLV